MLDDLFEHPILNSPYEYPARHWELDAQGQPTQRIIESRRKAEFITPIPRPRKRRAAAAQQQMVFDEGKGLSTQQQEYETTSTMINELHRIVDQWRSLPNPNDWHVTPEAARLLQHWRHHKFSRARLTRNYKQYQIIHARDSDRLADFRPAILADGGPQFTFDEYGSPRM